MSTFEYIIWGPEEMEALGSKAQMEFEMNEMGQKGWSLHSWRLAKTDTMIWERETINGSA